MKRKVRRTYKFKLYKSRRLRKLECLLRIACFIYNHCIALQRRYYRLFGKNISRFTLNKHLTRLMKQKRFQFWRELNSQTVQDVSERVCRSYKSFFSNHKKNKKANPPHFRGKDAYASITYKQTGYKFKDNVLTLQKKYRVKFSKSREINGTIKTVTVKRNRLGDWYLVISVEIEQNEVLPRTGETAGLDFGLKYFLTRDDGKRIESPLFFKQMKNEITKLCRSRSHKMGERKGEKKSHNWLKAQYKLQRAYERLRNLRDNFQWEKAHELCSKYAAICIEDLSLKGMAKLWGRKVNDLRFGEFVKKLEYMATKCGCTVIKVGKWFASSQICSDCGYKNEGTKDLRLRKWTCPNCGEVHDRDVNAAMNIRNEGLWILYGM